MTLAEIEAALDSHKLMCRYPSGKKYLARRTGKTKRWVTRPNNFRIPIKCRFNDYYEINKENSNEFEVNTYEVKL